MNRRSFVHVFVLLGKFLHIIYPFKVAKCFSVVYSYIYTGWISGSFNQCSALRICPFSQLLGAKNIIIGNNVCIGKNAILTAWSSYGKQNFDSTIILGDNCNIGVDAHLTAINKIVFGRNVLTGRNLLVTDNAHGRFDYSDVDIAPSDRLVTSKGPVFIEDNVWIGDNVAILPNVTIGESSIIAANSVVTKNVPKYALVAGNPAKVLKLLTPINN